MSKWFRTSKISFISIIILLLYIPLFFLLIFSFNKTTDRGSISFDIWNGGTFDAYLDLFSKDVMLAFANSAIVVIVTVLITTSLSLFTVYGLWRQKNKALKVYVDSTNNVPIINADIITAIGIAILLTSIFGTLASGNEGIWRAIISHVVMTFPYSILVMYPRSEKFNATLLKASYDLGYGKIRTWFKTYFIYMISPMLFSIIITIVFSFDDFILARITSNTDTVGTQLFAGQFQPWALAIGSILLIGVILGNLIYIFWKVWKNKLNLKQKFNINTETINFANVKINKRK